MVGQMCRKKMLVRVQDPSDGRIVRLRMPDSIIINYIEENKHFTELVQEMESEYGVEKTEEFWDMMDAATRRLRTMRPTV